MKRCPECRRDYFDDSLLYCLDDGTALLEGPAASEEPATAILPESTTPGEATTKVFENKGKKAAIAAAMGILLVVALGLGTYQYFTLGDSRQIDSIAVMPFVNESGNPDVDYLSDGITETLINTLTQLPSLKVKPRSSAFRY